MKCPCSHCKRACSPIPCVRLGLKCTNDCQAGRAAQSCRQPQALFCIRVRLQARAAPVLGPTTGKTRREMHQASGSTKQQAATRPALLEVPASQVNARPLNRRTPGVLQALSRGQPCPEALQGQAPHHHSRRWRSWPDLTPQRLLLLMPLHLPDRLPLCAHGRRRRLQTAAAKNGHLSATHQ